VINQLKIAIGYCMSTLPCLGNNDLLWHFRRVKTPASQIFLVRQQTNRYNCFGAIPQKASVDGSEAESAGKILTHGRQ
jgi:hypothetical protein